MIDRKNFTFGPIKLNSKLTQISSKKNKIRTILLIMTNDEINTYLRNTNFRINSESAKDLADKARVYDGIKILNLIINNNHNQNDIDQFITNQIMKENLYYELLLNMVSDTDSKILDNMGRIKQKNKFHRKDLHNISKDTNNISKVPKLEKLDKKSDIQITYLNTDRRNSEISILSLSRNNNLPNNCSPGQNKLNNTLTNTSLIMKSIYKHSKFTNDKKIEIAELFLNTQEKDERNIQKNINKLKLIVHKIKGSTSNNLNNNTTNFSHDNSLISIHTPNKYNIDNDNHFQNNGREIKITDEGKDIQITHKESKENKDNKGSVKERSNKSLKNCGHFSKFYTTDYNSDNAYMNNDKEYNDKENHLERDYANFNNLNINTLNLGKLNFKNVSPGIVISY